MKVKWFLITGILISTLTIPTSVFASTSQNANTDQGFLSSIVNQVSSFLFGTSGSTNTNSSITVNDGTTPTPSTSTYTSTYATTNGTPSSDQGFFSSTISNVYTFLFGNTSNNNGSSDDGKGNTNCPIYTGNGDGESDEGDSQWQWDKNCDSYQLWVNWYCGGHGGGGGKND